ncbi:MAG: type II toxin-antitoxin system prevent-host-death family antitoxin [Chloroflexi bacterium]|nr:type II toxin-antitoxin system prevent-host-death family antitoxin [Chloroflexota bacterium]
MQTKTLTSDQARQSWGELIDTVLAGEVVNIVRHNRPVAVVISAAMWEQILADYARLDDAEDLVAVYRSQLKKLMGIDDSILLTDEEVEAWLVEDEPVPA